MKIINGGVRIMQVVTVQLYTRNIYTKEETENTSPNSFINIKTLDQM